MNSISNLNIKHSLHIDKVDKINNADLVFWNDVFDVDSVTKLFSKKGTPGIFVSDHCTHCDDFVEGAKFVGLPLFVEQQRQMWTKDDFVDEKISTKHCFNFMINKKHLHRYLCIKLVEAFDLKSFVYTWSGIGKQADCKILIDEHKKLDTHSPLTQSQFAKILSPITIQSHFIMNKKQKAEMGVNVRNYGGNRYDYLYNGGNRSSWDQGCKHLFCNSAVSLITESIASDPTQKSTVFTEKTIYSILGLGFPIWIGGGYKQAEQWKSFGFDIFDDVINHDYQHYDTLLERCVYALLLNKKILTDLDHARSVRTSCLSRLESNRNLLLNGQLSLFIDNQIEKLNDYHKQLLKPFIKI